MCSKKESKTENKSPLKFRVNIQSDIVGVVERVNEREIAIPVTRNLRQPGGDAVLKWHMIQLIEDEEKRVVARFIAHTVNGTTFRRLGVSAEDFAESADDGDFEMNEASIRHLVAGTNFLQIRELYVLPAFQGQGLGSWLLREGPEILAEFLSQTFSYIVFPVQACIFQSEFLANQALSNDFARERFAQDREKQLVKMLKAAGYYSIPYEKKVFEKMF